jgi:hypothetical protein
MGDGMQIHWMCDLQGDLGLLITAWWLQKLRERLAVDKQAAQNIIVKRFSVKKLGELEVKKLSD